MNKNILLASTLVLGALASNAQPLLTDSSAYDDFSTKTEYSSSEPGRGIYWWSAKSQKLTRDWENSELDVVMTQGEYQYVPFGVGFGDSNGVAAGGARVIDISKNGKWSFTIKNTGTQGVSVRVACQDVNNKLIDCATTPPGMAFDGIWAYQTQIEVLAGKTVTFQAGTPNGAGGGKYNTCDFTKGVWGDYGTPTYPHIGSAIRTDCDLTRIKGINITVLNAAKNNVNSHALALTDGQFSLSKFKVGGFADKKLGVDEMASENEVVYLYPNPAIQGQVIHAPVQENTNTLITVTNTFGQIVYSNYHSGTTNDLSLDLSHLPAGLYFVGVGNQTQKLIIE